MSVKTKFTTTTLYVLLRKLCRHPHPSHRHLRLLSSTPSSYQNNANAQDLSLNIIDPRGKKFTVKGKVNQTILDVFKANGLDMNYGFGLCDGTITCGSCIVSLSQNVFDQLGGEDAIRTEELDLLDTHGREPLIRLGCQLVLSKDMDGMTVRMTTAAIPVAKTA